ncbi:MAG: DUF523 domain-containing protein [Gammaproteobacteria bacterium]|nr:DUF523 domain-containing protein [Gammaproteobacteria bacterium]
MNRFSTKTVPNIAISRCLLGEAVRYDGNSKFQPNLIKKLEAVFTLIPICPEVEIGLGVPRPPIHIIEMGAELRAVVIEDPDIDLTQPLQELASEKSLLDIDGFIVKARSPSCGLDSTPHLIEDGSTIYGAGIFSAAYKKANPLVPMVEAETLESPQELEKFIEEVITAASNC